MKSTAILLSTACFSLLGTVLSYRDITVFEREIDGEGKCLSRLPTNPSVYGQGAYQPVGYTLESFISLVEKVEFHHPQMSIFEVTNMLLERFYFSDIHFHPVSNRRRAYRNPLYRSTLLEELLPRSSSESREKFQEESLTEDEKCSLYFMIGHNLNDTHRGKIDTEMVSNGSPNNLESGQQIDGNERRIRRPREQGVVSLHSDPISAVAMGRVLLGIAAGEFKDMKKKLRDLGVKEQDHQNKEIEILTALTLGDAIANAEFKAAVDKNGGTSKYGPPGEWNSTTCPTEYRLLAKNTSTTDAEMRGSIDGYILGTYVKRMSDALQDKLKLSRLIRMYYGRNEIRIENDIVGFCFRRTTMEAQNKQQLLDTSEAIFVFFCTQKSIKADQASLEAFRTSFDKYNDYVGKLETKDSASQGYHHAYDICTRVKVSEVAEYDTPVDLFVVLDVSERNTVGLDHQIDVVGHLAGHMDIGNGAGSVTVLLNSRGGQQVFIKNETNSACATCKLTRMDLRGVERDNLASTLELLNRTLKEYEEARRYEPGVPAKTVIFFHYDISPVDEDLNRLKDAKRILHTGHRDVHIFAVGNNNGEILEYIVNSQSTKFTKTVQPVELANRIREEIKKVPATLQYHECGKPRSRVEDDHRYTGYVTPMTKQMWAMYPEYFLKSYTIEFRFKTEANSGKIKVCHERNHFDPSLTDKNNDRCQSSETIGQDIKFTITNPCHGYSKDNCRPIYFSVEGLKKDSSEGFSLSCDDPNCRRTDQIKFTVTHKGVACSGALGLLASPLVFLGVIYATLRHL